ncbi:hypothetical protein FSP39_010619 [Pinctada imbricata]|uniref:PH domain-containing protein n=1 Tax=Pinctada imbricata TaxID=66713 RepID=A0AA88XRG7_PINIB|nr:hypothetical protein FSP39_010619 [Pinctada imbricata]
MENSYHDCTMCSCIFILYILIWSKLDTGSSGTCKISSASVTGGRYKSWKRRWFILNDNCLYYFQFTTDKEPKGIIPLENIQVQEVTEKGSKPFCFELYTSSNDIIKACKVNKEGRVVEGKLSLLNITLIIFQTQYIGIEKEAQSLYKFLSRKNLIILPSY